MNSNVEKVEFPPRLDVGSRVWSGNGYLDHGPIEGPKVNIASNIGGKITGKSKPYSTYYDNLYAVQWDDGTNSKHYSPELVCIDRFQSLQEFESAIQLHGPIHVIEGPQGGFREANFSVTYNGLTAEVKLQQSDRNLWNQCILPKARDQKVKVVPKKLPGNSRSK